MMGRGGGGAVPEAAAAMNPEEMAFREAMKAQSPFRNFNGAASAFPDSDLGIVNQKAQMMAMQIAQQLKQQNPQMPDQLILQKAMEITREQMKAQSVMRKFNGPASAFPDEDIGMSGMSGARIPFGGGMPPGGSGGGMGGM